MQHSGAPSGGPAGSAGTPAASGGDTPRPIYVSYEEKRELSDRKPARKSSGHTYTVKFFLVDPHGTEYLAATGEDQGDAHYLYENQPSFPFLRANNKAEVRAWLEGIIARCKERAGVHSHLVTDAVPQDPSHIRLPKFTGHSHDKRELPDGRHRIEWYLLDERNDAHLAIVGEEKETRDGHYSYRTQGVFDKALPLQVGNQREVERWIDIMVFHGGVAPLGPAGKAPGDSVGGAPATSGRGHSVLTGDASGHRGSSSRAGHHGARPAGQHRAGQKHDLLKQATSNVKKLKAAGRADPDQEARDAVAGELTRWAQEEAQRREATKRQALAFATDPLSGREAAAAKRALAVLKQAAGAPGFLPPPPGGGGGRGGSAGGSHQQQLNLVDTLGALRELAHMFVPLSVMAMPELKEVLGQLAAHRHPDVAALARSTLEQWLRAAVAQAQVLTDPRYVQDPRSVLEASLASRAAMDPIVSALTHRALAPPPALPPLGVPRSTHAERPGSRLGASTVGGSGGGAGRLPGGAEDTAATPGGLSARPSEQSLQALAGQPAGAAAHYTAERRRLDLAALDSPAALLTSAGLRRGQQLSASSSGGGSDGAGGAGEPSSAAPSSALLPGDSAHGRQPPAGPHAINLACSASVDLIDAPIQDMEAEQAELLSGGPMG